MVKGISIGKVMTENVVVVLKTLTLRKFLDQVIQYIGFVEELMGHVMNR